LDELAELEMLSDEFLFLAEEGLGLGREFEESVGGRTDGFVELVVDFCQL
jgi:hypothetical protein